MAKYFASSVIQDDAGNIFVANSLLPVWGDLLVPANQYPRTVAEISACIPGMTVDRCRIFLMQLVALGLALDIRKTGGKVLYEAFNPRKAKIAFDFYTASVLTTKAYKVSKHLPYLRLFDCETPKAVCDALRAENLPRVSSYLMQYDLYDVFDSANGAKLKISEKGKLVLAQFTTLQEMLKDIFVTN